MRWYLLCRKYGAGTENHDCTAYDGGTGIYAADTGRGKIFRNKGRTACKDYNVYGRTCCRSAYIPFRNQRRSKRYRECNEDRACHGHHVRYVRYVWHDVSCYGGNQYLDGRAGLICGEDTAGQIDKEVLSIINNSYNEAMQMLTENREILDHISEYLYEKETITGKEFMKIFRKMKGLPQEEDKEALMPDDTEKDKKDSKAAFVSDDMFED